MDVRPLRDRYGNPWVGLLASWLRKCDPSCFQLLLGSRLGLVLVTLRPCSKVSAAEGSGSTFTRDRKCKLPGRSVLPCNSQFFLYLFIDPQDEFSSHSGQLDDPAESDSVPRPRCSNPGKEERGNQPSSFTREWSVCGYYCFRATPHRDLIQSCFTCLSSPTV